MDICSEVNCTKPVWTRQLCNTHYCFKIRNGELETRDTMQGWTIREKLSSAAQETTESGCILWGRALNRSGYGIIRVRNKVWTVHRLTYTEYVGPIPDGLVVRHKCDVRSCFNLDHLELGTPADNSRDMQLRTRHAFAKLSRDDASDIKWLLSVGAQGADIARSFNVSDMTISDIKRNKTWKHV